MNIENIDIKLIEEYVSELVRTPIIFKKELGKSKFGKDYMNLESEELVSLTGIFENTLNSAKCVSFNPLTENNDKTNFWCTISIAFETKNHGRNSVPLCTCIYNIEKQKWTFKGGE